MDPVVQAAVDAIERRDWDDLKPLLHPYLHWTEGDTKLRGRTKVLAHLEGGSTVAAPMTFQLRDGQIYRWTS
jgi:hypothetical protein